MRTIRTAAAFSSGLHLRLVGFPGDCCFGMAPSSFPRSRASRISSAIQLTTLEASRAAGSVSIRVRSTSSGVHSLLSKFQVAMSTPTFIIRIICSVALISNR